MKTDKNSRTTTTSGTDTHPEQAIPDTNPTRSKSAFFRKIFDDANSKVVIVPYALFWIWAIVPVITGSLCMAYYQRCAELENPQLPRVIKVDGNCIIEAKAVAGTEQKAKAAEVEKWIPADGVNSVEPVCGGQGHE